VQSYADTPYRPRVSDCQLPIFNFRLCRRWDGTTQLYYSRMRDYSPQLGRFLQPDPAGYIDGMNLYAYVGNNPLNWLDPWGLWTVGAHRRLGRYGTGSGKFDYARLDLDYDARNTKYTYRHYRDLLSAIQDAKEAAGRGDAKAFEYHVHEVQDYYSHRGAGITVVKHILQGKRPDIPDTPEKRRMYEAADRRTRRLEDYWDKYNPPTESEESKSSAIPEGDNL